jgi:hypothetical protein
MNLAKPSIRRNRLDQDVGLVLFSSFDFDDRMGLVRGSGRSTGGNNFTVGNEDI